MKTLKRMHILAIAIMLAALALPAVTHAQVEEGAGVTIVSEEQHITGSLDAMSSDYVTVGGQTITVDMSTQIQPSVSVGDVVEVSARVDSQGNLIAREIELAGNSATDDHSQDDSSNSGQDDSTSDSSQDDRNSNSSQDDDSSNSGQDSSSSSQDDSSSHDSHDDSSNSGQDENSSHDSHDDSGSNSGQDANSSHDSHDNHDGHDD
jgi:hypothetical protein